MPVVHVGDCKANADEIFSLIEQAEKASVEVVCFPELSLTGYTCGDLFFNQSLLESAEQALSSLLERSKEFDVVAIVGLPIAAESRLFNCAVAFQGGSILGIVPKAFLPNSGEAYEGRWFTSGAKREFHDFVFCGEYVNFSRNLLFHSEGYTFAIEISEELFGVMSPSAEKALQGAHIIFNPAASSEQVGKNAYLRSLISHHSARCVAGYVYASAGFGESSTDLLFASSAFIAESGSVLAESERFSLKSQLIISEIDIDRLKHDRLRNDSFKHYTQTYDSFTTTSFNEQSKEFQLTRRVGKQPFVPEGEGLAEGCREIFQIQTNALATRLSNAKIPKAVIGVSGGLDSTLALLVTVSAFDKLGILRENIHGITMPGFGTTSRTKNNSLDLMEQLGVSSATISIDAAVMQHFRDISHDPEQQDITYENSQARERTQILMDIANKEGAIVIGTGDMSEIALGWCTYNGDHMSMYGVNSGVPKTLIRHLVEWVARSIYTGETSKTLLDIASTPISPELLPAKDDQISQKTESIVGPYELHDFFLYYLVRFGFSREKILFLAKIAFSGDYDEATITKWLDTFIRRFFTQQFKRSCSPDGVKVGSVSLSPRGDWRMPSDISYKAFL